MKTKNTVKIILTAVFLGGMLLLTLTARAIHRASLPQISLSRVAYEYFPFEYTDADGSRQTGMMSRPAIETSLLGCNIYVVTQREKNGEKRDYASLVSIVTGAEKDDHSELVSGLYYGQKYYADIDGVLYDGCEVAVNDDTGK